MTDERRIESRIQMSDTLWFARKHDVIEILEKLSGKAIPEDCTQLIKETFRIAVAMTMNQLDGERRHTA